MLPDNSDLDLLELEKALKKCDSIKYAAYRTAAKLRIFQKALHLDKVQLRVVSCVFEKYQLHQTENSVQLDEKEVESVLSDIYFAIKKENNILLETDYVSHSMYKFLLNIYDKKMTGTIQVLSFKVGLTLLCQAKPREKYHYLFKQLADHNNCLSRKKLEILLKKMISMIDFIGEGLAFGFSLVPGTVESCFQCNVGSLGVSEDIFVSWLLQDPQLLVWLSTMYRMQISEAVLHNAKCGICKISPLAGFRYRCLRCISFDMCQSCFFLGKIGKKHKLKHPVQEYCCLMTSQQSTKSFLLTLRNRLYKTDSKLQYLPALKVDSKEVEVLSQSTKLLDEMDVLSRTVVNGSRVSLQRFPFKELQNIIWQLERESERLIPQIDNFCLEVDNLALNDYQSHLKSCLIKHKTQVQTQVERLKLLRKHLTSSGKFNTKAKVIASTPVVDEILLNTERTEMNGGLLNLSPITVNPFRNRERQNGNRKMMWDNYDLGPDAINPSWEEIQSMNNFETEGLSKERGQQYQVSTCTGKCPTLELTDGISMRGLTWLREDEEKIREENEETFEEIQEDLKRILNKLQELSVVTSKGDSLIQGVSVGDSKDAEVKAAEVDTILIELIKGIEKLVGS